MALSTAEAVWGELTDFPDSANGQYNASSSVAPSTYSHTLGYTAPNSTTNVGADYSLSPRLVLTGRFGYYFENYHDFGFPTTGNLTSWFTNGVGATDVFGNPLPASLQQPQGFINLASSNSFTVRNANKAIQGDVNAAWYKSGWRGTHNFKFGYQLNRLNNDVAQHYNVPVVQYYVGKGAVVYAFRGRRHGQLRAVHRARTDSAPGSTDTSTCRTSASEGKATSLQSRLLRAGFLVDRQGL